MAKAEGSEEAIRALEENWQAEKQSAQIYRDLASREKDPRRRSILLRMAQAEDRHGAHWEKKLKELGAEVPALRNTLAGRLSRWFNRTAGLEVAVRRMEAAEDRQQAHYTSQQVDALGQDAETQQILHHIAVEEKAHAKTLANLVPQIGPQNVLDVMLKRERWHRRGGSWVADAIYGVNDGLGAVFGIVSGVAGATGNQQHYVLIAGLAGMMASALSMGAGAYLAVKSEREVYEAEISREKREVEENPEEEKEEMALFYELQGFGAEDARRMADRLAEEPEQLLKAMAQSELGLSEQNFPNPWVSSLSASLSTAVGAFIPIIPFFFLGGFEAVAAAFAISIVAHFAVGAAKSLITMRSWWSSGLEMTLIGILEASVTYGLGLMFHAA